MSLLEVEDLTLSIGGAAILRDIDLRLERGKVLGLVGESGSGKSLTALSVMRLLPDGAEPKGRISFEGKDLLNADEPTMCRVRGSRIGMVFQEPMTALNPVKSIGEQVAESIRWHRGSNRADAERTAAAILARVGLPASRFPLTRYPHQLSGGQRQRVVIAIACALKPSLLIADEPTTALDVVLQAETLALLRELVDENEMALLLISHDLAVVAAMADQIVILRNGRVIETGETSQTLTRPAEPYTRQLIQASSHVPARSEAPSPPAEAEPLLRVDNVTRDYSGPRTSILRRGPRVRAVDGVSLSIPQGRSVALVGRSGCGKSTLARMVLALDSPSEGEIRVEGELLTGRTGGELRTARRNMQPVFQDPYGSFDPRQKAERLVAEPLHLLKIQPTRTERRERVADALAEVGLSRGDMDKYPHEFSGGQRQRLSIARAIIIRPKLIVADEPVSALDMSIRAQILDLFADLNQRLGIAYLFITHDLSVARAVTDDTLVMEDGRIVERGRTQDILSQPNSMAAKALVNASPDLGRILASRGQRRY